eukprot:gene27395-biopygen10824
MILSPTEAERPTQGLLTYLEVPVSLCEDLFLQPPTLVVFGCGDGLLA